PSPPGGCEVSSQFLRWLIRDVPRVGAPDPEPAPKNLVAAQSEDRVEVSAAKAEIGHFAVRRGNDGVHEGRLGADLDAQVRSDVKTAVAVRADAIGAALAVAVGCMQPDVTLAVSQRAVGKDHVSVK